APALREHLPRVHRLHEARHPARRPHAPAGDLRGEPRLDRAGRGRSHPPADRAARDAARDPGARGAPAGRRDRDGRGLAGRAGAARRTHPARAHPAEGAGAGPHPLRSRRRGAVGRVRAARPSGRAGGDPARERLGGARGARRGRTAAGRGRAGAGGVAPLLGAVRRATAGLPGRGAPARDPGPGGDRGGLAAGLAEVPGRGRPHAGDGGLRRLRAGRAAVPGVRLHAGARGGAGPAGVGTERMTAMATNPLVRLGELGQSPWLDFITRDLVASGELARLIAEDGLLGMTTNPTIFEKAIAGSALYDDDLRRLGAEGRAPAEIFEAIAVADVRAACDVFRATYERTGGRDGLVSIEVSPRLAHDTEATVREAERLWREVDRPNLMVKIPGTRAGLPAITRCIAEGINVNVTLLFSIARYEEVIAAYQAGLEARAGRGLPLDRVASVASFFVSRVDGKVDPLLDRLGDPAGLRGRIAIANACLAYRAFERSIATTRWEALARRGARLQRPLWASTSTKDPRYGDI